MENKSFDNKRKGVVICGAYGRDNAGDEAILKSIISELRTIDKDLPIVVMSRKPKDIKDKFGVDSIYTFNPFAFIKALKKSKVFLSGGGSLVQDVTSSRSLYFYLETIACAKKHGCKCIMYGCGVGPILTDSHKKYAARIINAYVDAITLRDSVAGELLSEIGVSNPMVVQSADPTFSLEKPSDEEIEKAMELENIPKDKKLIAFCLRKWNSFTNYKAVADAAKYAYEKEGLVPVFLPVEVPADIAIGQEIAAMIPEVPSVVCTHPHPDSEFIGLLSKMQLVVGMRLHSLLFATEAKVKTIALSYDVKIDGFFKDLDNKNIFQIDSIDSDSLCKTISAVITESSDKLSATVDKFVELEKNNVNVAREYLLGRKGESVAIMGIPLDNVTMEEAVEEFCRMQEKEGLSIVVTANPEILNNASKNEELKNAIIKSDLCFADGIALLTISKVWGTPFKERVAGIDFAYNAIKVCAKLGKSVYLLGGKEGVAEKALENLEKEIPGLKIAGAHNGYFGAEDEDRIVKEINDSGADFLCAAMGSPRQELFLTHHKNELKAKVGVGIGGSLDVWSGNVKRAPQFYQDHGIQWLYRLISEPKRIGRIIKIPFFMIKAMIRK